MTARTRHFSNVVAWISLILPIVIHAAVYDRVVGISYANKGGYNFNYAGSKVFDAFDLVRPQNVTAVVPFLLNTDASQYAGAMQALKDRNIVMIPAIGDDDHANIDDPFFKGLAQSYIVYTKYIRLELLEQFTNTSSGIQHVQSMINTLMRMGFEHIMLNPWPRQPGTTNAVPFTGSALESTIYAVSLDFLHTAPYTVYRNATNWYPPDSGRVNRVRNYKPSIAVLSNYENAPQHLALAGLSKSGQIDAMSTTIRQINTNGLNERWTAPWSPNYDPLREDTWSWIAGQLKQM